MRSEFRADETGEQIAMAQVLVYFFRRWNEKPDRLFPAKGSRDRPTSTDEEQVDSREVAHQDTEQKDLVEA